MFPDSWIKVIGSFVLMALVATLSIITIPQASFACLWDKDTLAAEASGLPEVPHILTGWFPRNPPLYYTMRLERTIKEIQNDPDNLSLYDDAAVAADRLGRSKEAIRLMDQKYEKLLQQDTAAPKLTEQWYRYYANTGTFFAHQWILDGRNKEDLSGLLKSKKLIEKAIEINPDAHFGREKYQLLIIEWLINNAESDQEASLDITPTEREEAVRGMSGLIALGGAWESIDVVNAIGNLAGQAEHSSIAHIAAKRSGELKEKGKEPIFFDRALVKGSGRYMLEEKQKQGLDSWYKKSRATAEDWHQKRTEYMLSRLRSGIHPDSDPEFWNNFQAIDPPPLYGSGMFYRLTSFAANGGIIGYTSFILILMVTARLLFVFSRKKTA